MPLRVLFVDMNSFFASVEQQAQPSLRGRPVAVVPVNVPTTCCIAVSQEAKQLGVTRGMPVWQAKKCASLAVVEARPEVYVRAHHAIVAAVESCIPIESIHSIDEMSSRLGPDQTSPCIARELAIRVKQVIADQVGQYLKCSIGLAPNKFLAKVASNMQKPDGLTIIEDCDLPHRLHPLALEELPGIARGMLSRLKSAQVTTVAQLCQLPEGLMRKIWGGVVGQRWWGWLRGQDLREPKTRRSSVGHSHVLPPEFRTQEGAHAVLLQLIHKAAARLRRLRHYARQLEVSVSFTFREEGWSGSIFLGMCQDTLTMIEAFHKLWDSHPSGDRPTQVAVTLSDLMPESSISLPLFSADRKRLELSRAMDQLNQHFGANSVYFGGIHDVRTSAPTRIAFSSIPDFLEG